MHRTTSSMQRSTPRSIRAHSGPAMTTAGRRLCAPHIGRSATMHAWCTLARPACRLLNEHTSRPIGAFCPADISSIAARACAAAQVVTTRCGHNGAARPPPRVWLRPKQRRKAQRAAKRAESARQRSDGRAWTRVVTDNTSRAAQQYTTLREWRMAACLPLRRNEDRLTRSGALARELKLGCRPPRTAYDVGRDIA